MCVCECVCVCAPACRCVRVYVCLYASVLAVCVCTCLHLGVSALLHTLIYVPCISLNVLSVCAQHANTFWRRETAEDHPCHANYTHNTKHTHTHTYTHRCTASCQPSESASACLFSLMEVRCGGGTVVSRVGQNHSFIGIHSVYTVSFGRDHLTIHTVIYGVYIRFWPALGMRVSRWASRIIQIMPYSTTLCLQYSVKYEEWGSNVFNSNLAEWGSNVNSNLVESCPTLQSSN